MEREDLEELHFLAPLANIPSILVHGILSNNRSKGVKHESCANQGVQDLRSEVTVPSRRPLHQYANVYINARNPMMYVLRNKHSQLAVLAVSPDILDLPGVIVTDRNAARGFAIFKPAPAGLAMIEREKVYAEFWTHADPIEQYEHVGIMCAEVLVPEKVEPRHIVKAYVSSASTRDALIALLGKAGVTLEIAINRRLFFQ